VILGGGVAVCLLTFVGTSRGHLCDSTAFLLALGGKLHLTAWWRPTLVLPPLLPFTILGSTNERVLFYRTGLALSRLKNTERARGC